MSKFSNTLSELRKDKKLSQRALSEILGLSHSTIGMYESGQREPNFETLKKLASYFNVSIDYLLGRTTNIPSWYSWENITNNDTHNEAVDLIDKVKEKYGEDSDVVKLISVLSGYMLHIENISLNHSISNNNENVKKDCPSTLKLYFDLNKDGKKLVDDYIEMIHSKEEYKAEDCFITRNKDNTGFIFMFKDYNNTSEDDEEQPKINND